MDEDTHPRQRDRYLALLRAKSEAERLGIALQLSATVRKLALAGLREQHPDATDEELRSRLTVRLYGREYAQRVFAHLPADAF